MIALDAPFSPWCCVLHNDPLVCIRKDLNGCESLGWYYWGLSHLWLTFGAVLLTCISIGICWTPGQRPGSYTRCTSFATRKINLETKVLLQGIYFHILSVIFTQLSAVHCKKSEMCNFFFKPQVVHNCRSFLRVHLQTPSSLHGGTRVICNHFKNVLEVVSTEVVWATECSFIKEANIGNWMWRTFSTGEARLNALGVKNWHFVCVFACVCVTLVIKGLISF